MARITSPVYSILSPPRGESEMSQLVSVTLLHQESTAPVKNGGLLLNSPFLLVPLFLPVSYKRKENITKKMNLERKKVKPLCFFFVNFFWRGKTFQYVDSQINSDKLGVYVSSASFNLAISRDTSTERINFFSKFKNVLTAFYLLQEPRKVISIVSNGPTR